MTEFLKIIPVVMDPRGRCNRKGLLVLMLVTLLLQACLGAMVFGLGLSFSGPLALTIKLLFIWVAISASIQRLHDVGRSGWTLLGAVFGLVVWLAIWAVAVPMTVALTYGAEHIQLFSPLFYVFVVFAYIPVIAGALWLHFKQGATVANKFGPVPDGSGFSRSTISVRRGAGFPTPASA